MTQSTVDPMSQEQFEQAIKRYVTWASEWDGALPADVFFGVWADLQREKKPLELLAHLVKGRLQFQAPTQSPVNVVDNRIYLEDGRELIIRLEPAV